MQKFCPNLELTRLLYRISIFRSITHEHKTTQRRKKCSRTTGGMILIKIFMSTREGHPTGVRILES